MSAVETKPRSLPRAIARRKGAVDRVRSPKAFEILQRMPLHDGFDSLDGHSHMLLVTWKKNGDAVPSPVWFAREGERLFVWTEVNAYKAKRLRRDPRALVAPCTATGVPQGDPIAARGRVLETDAERARAAKLLKRDWNVGQRLFERFSRRLTDAHYIELVPE
jgi:PPOX class probable F420-dependent enzyme